MFCKKTNGDKLQHYQIFSEEMVQSTWCQICVMQRLISVLLMNDHCKLSKVLSQNLQQNIQSLSKNLVNERYFEQIHKMYCYKHISQKQRKE